MLTTTANYRLIARDLDASLARTSEQAPVARETAYYQENISKISSIDDFIGNARIYNYAMKAFGLEDMAYAKAYMRKVLSEGVTNPDAFANKLNDERFVNFAKTFDFVTLGEATTATTDATEGVVDRYVRQTLEVQAGSDDDGVRLALYFKREAPNVSSVYGLLADTALWTVIKTTFGFPDEMANADIEQQAAMIKQRFDVADLQDPAKLDKLITRFTAVWDVTQNATSDPVLTLFDTTSQSTFDTNLLMTVMSLKHGGS
jgi:hypothetical protein